MYVDSANSGRSGELPHTTSCSCIAATGEEAGGVRTCTDTDTHTPQLNKAQIKEEEGNKGRKEIKEGGQVGMKTDVCK